jgi:hypothetical protein
MDLICASRGLTAHHQSQDARVANSPPRLLLYMAAYYEHAVCILVACVLLNGKLLDTYLCIADCRQVATP